MNSQPQTPTSGRRTPRAWLLLTLSTLMLGLGVRASVAGTPLEEITFAPLEPIRQFERSPRLRLPESAARINAVQARTQFNVDGTGLTAAVLDTGINPTHQDFPAGKILEQLNYTSNNGGAANNAQDGQGHGTNVSGIIAANGPTGVGQTGHTGIAPGAKLVAMKVLDNNGNGSGPALFNALQYLIDNHSRLNITVANLSLGTAQNLSDAPTNDAVRNQIAQLRAEKVAIVVSAGNAFSTFNSVQGMAWPGVIPETVSVGAVYDTNFAGSFTYVSGASAGPPIAADQFCPFSQRLHSSINAQTATDIFAPGAALTSTGIGSNTGSSEMHGTSQAAPVTAGVILLMQQYYKRLTGQLPEVDDIEKWLEEGAVLLTDSNSQVDNVLNTGLVFPRINALGSLQAIEAELGGEGNLSGRITAGASGLEGVTVSIGGQSTLTDANGDYAFSGLALGQYTVTPSKPPYVFTPTSQLVNVQPNAQNVDFTGAIPTFTVSGTVKEGARGLAGVAVSAGGQNATTATNGTYTLSGLTAGTYDVSVSKAGYKFTPPTASVTVGPNRTAINFAAAKIFSVSGRVTSNKLGLPGVTVTLQHTSGNRTAITGGDGTYTFSDVAAGAYKLVPVLEDYLFTPASRAVRVTTRSISTMHFVGAVIPDLTDLTLKAESVKGGRPGSGTVVLNGKAPVAMKVTLLSSNTAVARVPAFVNIPKGKSSAKITVSTRKVLTQTPVTISATLNGVTETVILNVTP